VAVVRSELLDGETPKSATDGSSRAVMPSVTLARIQPYLTELGITRVACITGLDRVGIPVWQAIRPASRGLSVSQGKGIDDDQSKASAIMESLEQHHAEHSEIACRLESYRALAAISAVVDPELLPQARDSVFTPELIIPWCEAVPVRAGRGLRVWVPFEMVHSNAMLPRVPGSGSFLRSTNGLASGNSVAEAVLHGLCELIERDAHSLWQFGGEERMASTRVRLDTVASPGARSLLDKYDEADIDVALWDMTSDLEIPAYRCIITERHTDWRWTPVPACYGAGCHPDPAVALSRALTEAAQSRLAAIAGSRDDLTRAKYHQMQAADGLASHRATALDDRQPVDVGERPSLAGATVELDLSTTLDRLDARGIDGVLAVDLSRSGWPVSVVRVIAPGLEGPSSSPVYRPGPRAREMAGRS
jgi:YcaO-like protein with predicted kinase domain